MAWKIVLLSILALILLLLFVPIGARLTFDGELRIRLRVMGIPVTLYPRKKKPKKAKAAKKSSEKAASGGQKEKGPGPIAQMLKEDGPGAVMRYLAELARLSAELAGRVLRAMTVTHFRLSLVIAGEDAAHTAVLHGAACAAVFPALAAIQSVVRFKRREVAITPDFLRETGSASFDIRLHILPYRLHLAGLRFIFGYIGHTLKENQARESLAQR